jgi:hypothetical protein
MLSTQSLQSLPDVASIKRICKAVSVLDALLCPEWEYRYYSYNSKWAEAEEFCEIRNGQGDHSLILFRNNSCVINGFMHEFRQPDKAELTKGLPNEFREFIYGEPVHSIGSTFCIWNTGNSVWQSGKVLPNDGSGKVLHIFDNNPQTYINWASGYFGDNLRPEGISLQAVNDIYQGKALNKEMVLNLVPEIEDWEQLEQDLQEIDYPFIDK